MNWLRMAWLFFFGLSLSGLPRARADEQPASVDYARDIKPLLAKHCVACHGAKKQEASLRLDTGVAAVAGGDSGAAVAAGKADESLLVKRVTGADGLEKMPPEGPGLSADEIALLRRWIDGGAQSPTDEAAEEVKSEHWSFQPLARIAPPAVKAAEASRSPIDRFIQAKLDEKNLSRSPEADRATLLRRLSLDLLGLLPAPDDVAAFVADGQPDAYERLVDRLLASPAYGERWGRHWLDQARYADSNGYTRDFGREIWLFREWVIRAINRDLSFDQFTIEQLAGDLLPGATTEQMVATGFHRNTLVNEEGGTDQEQFRVEAVADRVATTGQVWLGLTLGCARCHNHKYDPISQRDFYQFFAFLNNCDEPTIEAPSQLNLERGDLEKRAALRQQIAELEKTLEERRPELEAKQQEWEKTVTPEQRSRLPGPVQVAYDMPFDKRDAANKKLIEDFYKQSETGRKDFPALDEIAKLRDSEPKIPVTMVLKERLKPRDTHVHKRGDFLSLGVKVQPAVPQLLRTAKWTGHSVNGTNSPSEPSTLNRLDLARWLVDPANPLTPRVIMNRHWQQFFGRGLVETEDDFGLQGHRPTHPELLDWLASEFVGNAECGMRNTESQTDNPQSAIHNPQSNWSTKLMHRVIATSGTYRQSSRLRPELSDVDPRNELFARQSRLRVDAEIVRDAALAASGLLTRMIGGPSVMPPQPDGVYAFTQDPKPWKAEQGGNRFRRGMYTFFWRSLPFPMLTVFDAPNGNVSCTRRLRSNTPLQALTLANDAAFVECSQSLALRVLQESPPGIDQRARYAFRICLSREPTPLETERLIALVNQQQSAFATDEPAAKKIVPAELLPNIPLPELAAWTTASRVLLNLDEFITRE